jgi:hypothetical protein
LKDRQGRTWQQRVAERTGLPADRLVVFAPSVRPSDSRSDAMGHGDLDDDSTTMTSVLARLLGRSDLTERMTYRAFAGLEPGVVPAPAEPAPVVPLPVVPAGAPVEAADAAAHPVSFEAAAMSFAVPGAIVIPVGEAETEATVVAARTPAPEVGVAPHAPPIVGVLQADGWTVEEAPRKRR